MHHRPPHLIVPSFFVWLGASGSPASLKRPVMKHQDRILLYRNRSVDHESIAKSPSVDPLIPVGAVLYPA
jgi:hypothetical protein